MTIIDHLITLLGTESVLTGTQLSHRFHHIWQTDTPLNVKALVLPRSTDDVSEILKLCYKFNQTVVPFGGLTNLVGGTETEVNDIVISLEKMNTIIEIDTQSRTLTVEAGVILETIQNYLKDFKLLFPLNFGAKGSAQIGGIISTNAGGLRVLRYGMTRALILGLEVVLADGTILSNLKKIVKDNSGYDLKQLFIGAEGTLGIVTKAVLKLSEAPTSRCSAWVACNTYDKVTEFLRYIDQGLSGLLSGFELVWKDTFKTLTMSPSVKRSPLPYNYNYYILVEALGSNPKEDLEHLENLLEHALENQLIEDAVVAYSNSDLQEFWHIRENVDELVSNCVYDQHFDISIPISTIGDIVETITAKLYALPNVSNVYAFGHVADGNIHFIVGKDNTTDALKKEIDAIVYEQISNLHGSVSAEHGIGNHKKAYLNLCKSDDEIATMQLIKRALDPKNILNRGKLL